MRSDDVNVRQGVGVRRYSEGVEKSCSEDVERK
jgi:hypothetical protein